MLQYYTTIRHSDFFTLLKSTKLTLSSSSSHDYAFLISYASIFGVFAVYTPQEELLARFTSDSATMPATRRFATNFTWLKSILR